MTCTRHNWLEVGHIGTAAITVECPDCGATAVVNRAGALLTGPFTQATLWPTARYEQLAMAL
jgi:hypothetical protein